jgi:hypothetical protein
MIVLRRGTGTGTSEQASRCLFAPLCDDERERERELLFEDLGVKNKYAFLSFLTDQV